jgi:hypothetical protein
MDCRIRKEGCHVIDGKERAIGFERLAHTSLMAEFVPRLHVQIVIDEHTPLRPLRAFVGATRLEVTFHNRAWRQCGIRQ